jgi:hypothetical protein
MGRKTVIGKRWTMVYCGFQKEERVLGKRIGSLSKKGVPMEKWPELTGGGLVCSADGWSAVKALRRTTTYMKGDERKLEDSDFVQTVLKQSQEAFEIKYRLIAQGVDLETLTEHVYALIVIPIE